MYPITFLEEHATLLFGVISMETRFFWHCISNNVVIFTTKYFCEFLKKLHDAELLTQ